MARTWNLQRPIMLMSIALLVAGSLFALLFVQQSARAGTYAWGLSFRRAPPRA